MPDLPPSIARLIARLDDDTSHEDVLEVCEAVKLTLIEEIGTGALELPPALLAAAPNDYARRLLHAGPNYAVVIMVWSPGQGTPIHDHDGQWCVECVYSGSIQVRSYDLVGTPADETVTFEKASVVTASRGMAGSLIPPFDYHVIENVSTSEPAVTVHVYGGEMIGCSVYRKLDDGRYQRERRTLRYTDETPPAAAES